MRLLFVSLWVVLCISVIYVLYHQYKFIRTTDIDKFSEDVEELILFYEENWVEVLSGSENDGKRPFPDNPSNIPYAVFDSEDGVLAASYRGIEQEQIYFDYDIRENGETLGEVRIYYSILSNRIGEYQTSIRNGSFLCLGILMILVVVILYRLRVQINQADKKKTE